LTFIDKSIKQIAGIIKSSYVYWETSEKNGLFQRLDPRVKVVFMIYFILIVSLLRSIYAELAIAAFIFILVILSRLDILQLYKRILFFSCIFGFLIAAPSALNIITPGEIIMPVAEFDRAYHFWIYSIPREIGVTREGGFGVAMLTLRVANSLSISLLVIHTTPFFEIIRALKVFRVPDTLLMIIILSYKYIFILARTVEDMYLAMKSRLAGPVESGKIRALIAGRVFFIFKKSYLTYEETFRAMQGRGFSGDMAIYSSRAFNAWDAAAALIFVPSGIFFIVVQKLI
jgi:cobalt/nickel transport system permease protein